MIKGTCQDCMILRATADITDKDGNRLGLRNAINIHHIIVANLARPIALIPPLVPIKSSCTPAQWADIGKQIFGGQGGVSTPKGSTGHSHPRRMAQTGGSGFGSFQSPLNFDLFIVKGNEGDAQVFSPYNTENVKSGYWIGGQDRISALVSSELD
jgi:hypothetical protein